MADTSTPAASVSYETRFKQLISQLKILRDRYAVEIDKLTALLTQHHYALHMPSSGIQFELRSVQKELEDMLLANQDASAKLKYDPNGGKFAVPANFGGTEGIDVVPGSCVQVLAASSSDISKPNHRFCGWNLQAVERLDGNTICAGVTYEVAAPTESDEDAVKAVTLEPGYVCIPWDATASDPVILYATWEPIPVAEPEPSPAT